MYMYGNTESAFTTESFDGYYKLGRDKVLMTGTTAHLY